MMRVGGMVPHASATVAKPRGQTGRSNPRKCKCTEPECTRFAVGASNKCIRHGRSCDSQPLSPLCCCFKLLTDAFALTAELCCLPRSVSFALVAGGGRRCCEPGCQKSAAQGTPKCKAHGGGRRCAFTGCTKSAQGSTTRCVAHGGGRQCAQPGCVKAARGATLYCVSHGGGTRCKFPGCRRGARGRSENCKAHSGAVPPPVMQGGDQLNMVAAAAAAASAAANAAAQMQSMANSGMVPGPTGAAGRGTKRQLPSSTC